MTEQPLSEKRYSSMDGWDAVNKEEIKSWHYQEEDVKQAIQKTLKELKESNFYYSSNNSKEWESGFENALKLVAERIDTTFKQNFGDKLI